MGRLSFGPALLGSQDTASLSQSGKEPKLAREDATPAAASGELSASTFAAKKAKKEEDLDNVAALLAAASAFLEFEDARKFHQLWRNGGTSESLVMTSMLMKMSNSHSILNFQLSILAKLVLQFEGQLCELSAKKFAVARFAKELSFDKLPTAVQEHLDSTAV